MCLEEVVEGNEGADYFRFPFRVAGELPFSEPLVLMFSLLGVILPGAPLSDQVARHSNAPRYGSTLGADHQDPFGILSKVDFMGPSVGYNGLEYRGRAWAPRALVRWVCRRALEARDAGPPALGLVPAPLMSARRAWKRGRVSLPSGRRLAGRPFLNGSWVGH